MLGEDVGKIGLVFFSPSFAIARRRGEGGGDTDVAFFSSSPVTGHREEERRGGKIVRFPLFFRLLSAAGVPFSPPKSAPQFIRGPLLLFPKNKWENCLPPADRPTETDRPRSGDVRPGGALKHLLREFFLLPPRECAVAIQISVLGARRTSPRGAWGFRQ